MMLDMIQQEDGILVTWQENGEVQGRHFEDVETAAAFYAAIALSMSKCRERSCKDASDNVLHDLRAWILTRQDCMTPTMLGELAGIVGDLDAAIEDEVAYAISQTRNDYEDDEGGVLTREEVEEYYIALPLDEEGFPIHDVELVLLEA